MKKIFLLTFMLFISLVSYAQYEHLYKVSNYDTYITTLPNAILYELYGIYNQEDIVNCDALLVHGYRDVIDVSGQKGKNVKKIQKLRVLRYINTIKQRDFNAYIVEYKDKLWVLEGKYVQDNSQLDKRSSELLQFLNDKKLEHNVLVDQMDSLNGNLDVLLAKYIKECTDSLNYYKNLKARLPIIRDSLVSAKMAQEQEKVDVEYNKWYNAQPITTKNASKIIKITSSYLHSPNSAGGCDYTFCYENNSPKTIKYLYWTGTVYNAVNDPVYCEIDRTATHSGKDTGPVVQGNSGGGTWNNILYNYSADTLKLKNIRITYMDGSSASIAEADIRRLLKAPNKKVFVTTYDIRNNIISEDDCQQKINKWATRLSSLEDKSFSERKWRIYNDRETNDLLWGAELIILEDEIKNKRPHEDAASREVDNLEKFINFEKFSPKDDFSIFSSYKNYGGSNSSSSNSKISNKVKNPFVALGIDGSIEGLKSFSTGCGLSMRVGRFNSRFNSTIGIKYQYTGYKTPVSYSYDRNYSDYYDFVYSYADYNRKVNQFVFPVVFNWNAVRNESSSFYLGLGYEFGILLSDDYEFEYDFGDTFSESDFYTYGDSDFVHLSVPSRNVILQMGFAGRHCDWNVYYKVYTNKLDAFNGEKGAIGTAFTYYF